MPLGGNVSAPSLPDVLDTVAERERRLEDCYATDRKSELGRGHYGLVCRGRRMGDNLIVAIKSVPKKGKSAVGMLRGEINVMRALAQARVLSSPGGADEWPLAAPRHADLGDGVLTAVLWCVFAGVGLLLTLATAWLPARPIARRKATAVVAAAPPPSDSSVAVVVDGSPAAAACSVHAPAQPGPASSPLLDLIDAFEDRRAVHLVLHPACTGGELFGAIATARLFFSERQAVSVLRQLLRGVLACHTAGIVHRDIKPENILLTAPGVASRIKLIDFGLATWGDSSPSITAHVGTPYYIAPEVLAGRGYGRAVDLWSVGVVAFTMLGGYPPFFGDTERDIFRRISRGTYSFGGPEWSARSAAARDFVRRLLVSPPWRRMTASEALCHPWLLWEGSPPPLLPSTVGLPPADDGGGPAVPDVLPPHRALGRSLRAFASAPALKRAALRALVASGPLPAGAVHSPPQEEEDKDKEAEAAEGVTGEGGWGNEGPPGSFLGSVMKRGIEAALEGSWGALAPTGYMPGQPLSGWVRATGLAAALKGVEPRAFPYRPDVMRAEAAAALLLARVATGDAGGLCYTDWVASLCPRAASLQPAALLRAFALLDGDGDGCIGAADAAAARGGGSGIERLRTPPPYAPIAPVGPGPGPARVREAAIAAAPVGKRGWGGGSGVLSLAAFARMMRRGRSDEGLL